MVYPAFWTSDTIQELKRRGRRDGIVMATYLITCRSATSIGIYYLPEVLLCHEAGITANELAELWTILGALEFAKYDRAREEVFVPEMAAYQIGQSLEPGDKRIAWVKSRLNEIADSPFVVDFLARYGELYHLVGEKTDAPSEGLLGPIEASSSNSRSRTMVKDKDRGQEADGGAAERSPRLPGVEHVVLTFSTVGSGPSSWTLTREQAVEWQRLYPALDIVSECRKAAAWIAADGARRKTAKGMPKFLVGWLNRAVDSASTRSRSPEASHRVGSIPAGSSDERRSRLAALSHKDVA